jgi:hypothetical protein
MEGNGIKWMFMSSLTKSDHLMSIIESGDKKRKSITGFQVSCCPHKSLRDSTILAIEYPTTLFSTTKICELSITVLLLLFIPL